MLSDSKSRATVTDRLDGMSPARAAEQVDGRRGSRRRCGSDRYESRAEHRFDGIGDLPGGGLAAAVTIGRRGWAVKCQHPAAGTDIHEGQDGALLSQFRIGLDRGLREMVAPDPADRRLAQAGGIGDRACRPAAGRRFPQHARQSPVDHLVGCSGAAGSRCVGQILRCRTVRSVASISLRCGNSPRSDGRPLPRCPRRMPGRCAPGWTGPAGFAVTPSSW